MSSFVFIEFWLRSVFSSFNEEGEAAIYQGTERRNIADSACVWVYFSGSSPAERGIFKINDKFDSTEYKSLLNQMVQQQQERIPTPSRGEFNFVHDCNPVNRSKAVKEWFQAHPQFDLVPWPPCFGDVNPIETLWVDLEFSLHSVKIDSPEHLISVLFKKFDELTESFQYRHSLVNGVKDQLQKIIDVDGFSA